jgi:glycolate oxidase
MTSEYVSNEEIVQAARRNLPQGAWDFVSGASESETTQRRNRLAFDRIAFRPRVLRDVSNVDTSTKFLGQDLRIPVMLAPVGGLQNFTPEGATASTKAAAEFGIMHVLSSVTEPTLEDTASAVDYPKMFQLYLHGDWEWTVGQIARIKEAGFKALCITVDTASYSRRERPLLGRTTPVTVRDPSARSHQASVTWETIDRIKDEAGLPLMLKGIATAEDAAIAIEHGVDVVWVSNHGGRQLDHGLGTMDMLGEIVDAVEGKAEIVLDGGVQRGGDIAKAVALGVKAVAIGKMQVWGLGANGQAGLVRLLEILEEELTVAMGLLGTPSIGDITSDYVCEAEPVTSPHEMSSWVNMPVSRIM